MPNSTTVKASGRLIDTIDFARNFEVFTLCDFIAAITQHIPDKSFQLVHYYGWYSNKMRGRRAKQADEEAQVCSFPARRSRGAPEIIGYPLGQLYEEVAIPQWRRW